MVGAHALSDDDDTVALVDEDPERPGQFGCFWQILIHSDPGSRIYAAAAATDTTGSAVTTAAPIDRRPESGEVPLSPQGAYQPLSG
jgi:hypothetical protein